MQLQAAMENGHGVLRFDISINRSGSLAGLVYLRHTCIYDVLKMIPNNVDRLVNMQVSFLDRLLKHHCDRQLMNLEEVLVE